MLLLGASLVAAGVGVSFVHVGTGIGLFLAGLVIVGIHRVTVRVDLAGVRVAWGLQKWPQHTYPLDVLTGAEELDIHPLKWGGWGYRISGRGVGIVVRRGPGVVLHRVRQRDVAITVDDAGNAAASINSLVR